MTTEYYQRQLTALREGSLRLDAPGETGLTEYASTTVYELRAYVAALEAGYRTVCEIVDAYRANEQRRERFRESSGGKKLQKLMGAKWSPDACLGYAFLGMRAVGFDPEQTIKVLEAMDEQMEKTGLESAAEVHKTLREACGIGDFDDPDGGLNRWNNL